MKRKLVKSLLFAFVICSLTVLTLISVSAKTVTKNKLVYETEGKTATLVECKSNAKKITVPSKVGKYKVTAIGEWAFSERTKLEKITLPSTITVIGKAAFNECTALKKIVIPSSVKKINASAFWDCKNLESAVIPKSVKTIGKNVFYACNNLKAYVVKGSKAEKYIKKQSGITLAYRYMTSLTLSSSSLKITEGDKATLTAVKKPQKLYNAKVTYSSSNPKAVTVNAKGVLTAKSAGTAVITCTAKDGSGKKATCTVTVTKKPAAVPKAPDKVTGLKVTAMNNTGYTLSWNQAKNSDGYVINRYDSESKSWTRVGSTKNTSYTLSSRPLGSAESYTVTAYILSGTDYIYSAASESVSASTLKPSAVTGVTVTDVTENTVSLSWTKATGATGYKIYLYDESSKEYEYKWATQDTKATIKGLSADSEYIFAVKSYTRTALSSLDCTAYSSAISAETLPGKVTEITASQELIYTDRLTLTWNGVSGADGYNLYIYDKATGAYELYKSISANENLTAEITGLDADTVYSFKIKTYKQVGGSTDESGWSKAFAFRTSYIPQTGLDGAQSFIDAYNGTKKLTDSCTFLKSFSAEADEAEDSAEYENILASLLKKETGIYNVENGVDTSTGKTLYELIYPYSQECGLSVRDIDADSLVIKEDGFGHNISFILKGDKAFEIVCPPDFEKIAEENEGFILTSFEAQDGSVKATIVDGTFSWLKISVPVTVGFVLNGERYEISCTLSQNYYFQ